MELSPEEKQRIYEEEKARLEAQAQIKQQMAVEESAKRGLEASKSFNKGCLGFLAIIGIIFLIIIISALFSSSDRGKEWSDVQYEVSIFYEAHQIEDSPDRKVWIGKVREGSLNAATLTATRLPNGKWRTEFKHMDIPVR
jgi:hypothetical protein